jgi:hypothetical protein
MLLNLGIGLCHPPVGAIPFVGCAVGKVTIEQVMRKICGDVPSPDGRHLHSGNLAVAAAARVAVGIGDPGAAAGRFSGLRSEKPAPLMTVD